jgi:hypothetical protein
MTEFLCELLSKHHERSRFSSGSMELDTWLKQKARQDQDRRVAAVYVLTPKNEPTTIAGFYSLSATAVTLSDMPAEMAKKLPKYPLVPATLLGRLARDEKFPGTGERLLFYALQRAWQHSLEVASAVVVVDAKDERARDFYLRHGFKSLTKSPQRLALPMRVIESIVAPDSYP